MTARTNEIEKIASSLIKSKSLSLNEIVSEEQGELFPYKSSFLWLIKMFT
jgi:hypothetical protein